MKVIVVVRFGFILNFCLMMYIVSELLRGKYLFFTLFFIRNVVDKLLLVLDNLIVFY